MRLSMFSKEEIFSGRYKKILKRFPVYSELEETLEHTITKEPQLYPHQFKVAHLQQPNPYLMLG